MTSREILAFVIGANLVIFAVDFPERKYLSASVSAFVVLAGAVLLWVQP